jgi:hypothetical protein
MGDGAVRATTASAAAAQVREINLMTTRLCCGSCGDAGIGGAASAILNQTLAGVTDILGDELDRIAGRPGVLGLFFTGVAAPSAA